VTKRLELQATALATPAFVGMNLKTIEDAAARWRLEGLFQIHKNYWLAEQHGASVVVRFDKEAGWCELFMLAEYKAIDR